MAVLAECPHCRRKQSLKNKKCQCGGSLDKLKKQRKVRLHIDYPLGNGKRRRESVGSFEGLDPYSITDAKAALAKRTVQKHEKRIFEMLPDSVMTFQELTDWYLNLKKVRKIKSYDRIKQVLKNFNVVFGNKVVDDIKLQDLENYQEDRKDQGMADATIDKEMVYAKAVAEKAFYNDMIDGRILKAFGQLKNMLKKVGANARTRKLSFDEYVRLIDNAPRHLKSTIIIAFNTGMRKGEIRLLKWSYIDRKKGFIRLPKELTKEERVKSIPINHHVEAVLNSIPRNISHGFVIDYKGKPITSYSGMERSFKTACIRSDIVYGQEIDGGLVFKDMRRTVKSNMAAAGVDKVYRDTILGHSLKGMDVHYIVPTDDDLKNAMDKYTEYIDCQVPNFDHSFDHETIRAS